MDNIIGFLLKLLNKFKSVFYSFFKMFNNILKKGLKNCYKYKSSYKKGFKIFVFGLWKKTLDFIYILIIFFGVAGLYYISTGINHSIFTSNQIEEFIKKEIPSSINFTAERYLLDLKGYGEKDLIIIIRPREELDVADYNQENWSDKIFIFSKIQKNPIQSLLFSGDIYKKDFSFEFEFNNFFEKNKKLSNTEKIEINSNYNDYNLAKANIYLKDIFPLKRNSNFVTKSDLIINGVVYHNGGNNDYFYGILTYKFGGYEITPLINLNEEEGINCYDLELKKYDEYCINGIDNIKIKSYINNELRDIKFSSIIIQPGFIEFSEDYNFFTIYLHNKDCKDGMNYGFADDCSYIQYRCDLGTISFNCNLLWGENNIINRGTDKYSELIEKITTEIHGLYLK